MRRVPFLHRRRVTRFVPFASRLQFAQHFQIMRNISGEIKGARHTPSTSGTVLKFSKLVQNFAGVLPDGQLSSLTNIHIPPYSHESMDEHLESRCSRCEGWKMTCSGEPPNPSEERFMRMFGGSRLRSKIQTSRSLPAPEASPFARTAGAPLTARLPENPCSKEVGTPSLAAGRPAGATARRSKEEGLQPLSGQVPHPTVREAAAPRRLLQSAGIGCNCVLPAHPSARTPRAMRRRSPLPSLRARLWTAASTAFAWDA